MTSPGSVAVAVAHRSRGRGRPSAVDARVRLVAALTLWAGLLAVTYWWVAGGGLQDLGGRATGLTSLGRLTGLLAADLMLVQVLLMSRLPWLETAFGQDRLARIHRVVGFTSFTLMSGHVALVTWGYAAGRVTATPSTFWVLVTDYPGMLLALAGTACLVLVVLTSLRSARARLRYESWHLLHLYAYLGVGLALPHQLWTGQELLVSPAATLYWWTLWGAALAAVLVFRVGVPVARNLHHGLRVTSVVREARDVVSVYVTGRHLDRLRVESGQFFTWRFLTGPGWSRANPYSVSAAPDGRSLRITVKDLGDGSRAVARLHPGAWVLVEGPFGRLSGRARTGAGGVVLAAAGVGITPLRALAEDLDYAPGRATLLYRFSGDPLFADELRVLAHERGLVVRLLPGRRARQGGWLPDGSAADAVAALRAWVPDVAACDVYVCGPAPWAADVRRTALAAGTPADQIHLETFGW
jgi:predicted ferric reductase